MIASADRPEVKSAGCQEKNSHGIFGPIVYDIPNANRTGIWAKDHLAVIPTGVKISCCPGGTSR